MNLKAAQRSFAEELRFVAHVTDEHEIDAFATVPRELFVGPGPWRVLNGFGLRYWTADSDPRALYHKEDTCWPHGNGWCLSKRELH